LWRYRALSRRYGALLQRYRALLQGTCVFAARLLVMRRHKVYLLFRGDTGLFCGEISFFCRAPESSLPASSSRADTRYIWTVLFTGLFCRDMGLFCRDTGLFCRDTGLFCGEISLFCRAPESSLPASSSRADTRYISTGPSWDLRYIWYLHSSRSCVNCTHMGFVNCTHMGFEMYLVTPLVQILC